MFTSQLGLIVLAALFAIGICAMIYGIAYASGRRAAEYQSRVAAGQAAKRLLLLDPKQTLNGERPYPEPSHLPTPSAGH